MIGFEVTINDQVIAVALEDGVTSVILNRIKIKKQNRDGICIDISGLNTETQENHKWLSVDLKVGDSINIFVKEIAKSSPSTIKKSEPKKS